MMPETHKYRGTISDTTDTTVKKKSTCYGKLTPKCWEVKLDISDSIYFRRLHSEGKLKERTMLG